MKTLQRKSAENELAQLPLPGWPAWITRGELDLLPTAARGEIEALVVPAYRELVLEAESALSKASGQQFVFLLWSELLQMFRLSGEMVKPPDHIACYSKISVEYELDRCMAIGDRKLKVASVLVQLQLLRERLRREVQPALNFAASSFGRDTARPIEWNLASRSTAASQNDNTGAEIGTK